VSWNTKTIKIIKNKSIPDIQEAVGKNSHNHKGHHANMVKDFRRRFWISLAVSIPIFLLSPMIQRFLGIREPIRFTGDLYILFLLSSFIYFYGVSISQGSA
jgi:Cu2+-exporting ATPase